MKKFTCLIAFLLVLFLQLTVNGQEDSQPIVSVTYVANEGFLINTGDKKILIDALFGGIKGNWCQQPSDSLLNIMITGQPPFDFIDVVFVTHYHSDHFNGKMVSEFMLQNPKSVLVCPCQVSKALEKNPAYSSFSNRILNILPSEKTDSVFSVGEIQINALRLNHGSYFEKDTITGETIDLHKDVENIAYIIKTNYVNIFHGGDASIKSFDESRTGAIITDEIDIAFLNRVLMKPEGMKIISDVIKPKKLVFIHVEPGKAEYYRNIIKDYPDITIFSNTGETKFFNMIR